MSTPLIATYRVTVPYTESSQLHKVRMYVRIATTTPTYTLRYRDGVTTQLWSTSVQRFLNRASNALAGANPWGTGLLENLQSGIWIPVDSFAFTQAGTGATVLASQLSVILRDTTFKKLRVCLLDTNQPGPVHYADTPSAAGIDNFIAGFKSTASSVDDPYFWMVGRSNNYLLGSPIAGLTVTFNKKLRRARGMT